MFFDPGSFSLQFKGYKSQPRGPSGSGQGDQPASEAARGLPLRKRLQELEQSSVSAGDTVLGVLIPLICCSLKSKATDNRNRLVMGLNAWKTWAGAWTQHQTDSLTLLS